MKKSLRLTPEHILYGIALANALRLAWAYATADAQGQLLSLPGAFGLMLGGVISIGTAFISGRLGAKLTKARLRLTWIAFVTLLVLEPVILAPITMMDMPDELRNTLGGFAWAWAVILALVPSLVLAGVSVASGGVVDAVAPAPQSKPQSDASEDEKPLSGGKRSQKSQPKPPSEFVCAHAGAGCDRTFASQNAANAHARTCQFKPTVSMPVE